MFRNIDNTATQEDSLEIERDNKFQLLPTKLLYTYKLLNNKINCFEKISSNQILSGQEWKSKNYSQLYYGWESTIKVIPLRLRMSGDG